jgi:hypothetical protein
MSTWCWFCPVCTTLTLLEKAAAGECCKEPKRADCPLPFPIAVDRDVDWQGLTFANVFGLKRRIA